MLPSEVAETVRDASPALLGVEPRFERFDLPGKENDRSSLPQPEDVFCGYGQRRDVVQRGLNRKQGLRAGGVLHQIRQLFQRNQVRLGKPAYAGPVQGGNMPFRTEFEGQIARQGPDVSALAALDLDGDVISVGHA